MNDFFQFLEDGDFLQRHAFGKASYTLNSGEDVEMDKVSTTHSTSALLRKYAGYVEEVAMTEIDIPADTDQCRKRYPTSRVRCLLVKDHDGNAYLPQSHVFLHRQYYHVLKSPLVDQSST